jgi:hypothetical protein
VRPLGGVVCPDTPIRGSLGVPTDVHGQCCGVQGAAGLELDEQWAAPRFPDSFY